MDSFSRVFESLWRLVVDLSQLVVEVLQLGLTWSLLIAWVAWWLLGVNWKRVWPHLARGAWAPAVLLVVVSALVWSRIAPSECNCLGFVTVPNFWWQLGGVGLLAATALFLGWLQGVLGWTPEEFDLNPPAAAHGHGHDHGHH